MASTSEDLIATFTDEFNKFKFVAQALGGNKPIFDKEATDSILGEDLRLYLMSLTSESNPTKAELKEMTAGVKILNSIGSRGYMNFELFCKWKQTAIDSADPPRESEENILALFKSFDTDNSGQIDAKELRVAMQAMGDEMSVDEVKKMMDEADIDHNGTVSLEEFTKMMNPDV